MSADAKIREGEALLFDLAAQLRFVPVDERNMGIHVRALELKRELRSWERRFPGEAAAERILDEIRALTVRVSGSPLPHPRYDRHGCESGSIGTSAPIAPATERTAN